MKKPVIILLFFYAIAYSENLCAASISSADSAIGKFELEAASVLRQIYFEKLRISNNYNNADSRLFNLIDSITAFVSSQNIPLEKQNQYLRRLLLYLKNINHSYSENYLKSGTYLAVLSYYPSLIEWDQKDELQRNLKRFSAFSIKAIGLIPNDTIAEDFLSDYMVDHPDEIFRYTEEFANRPFALTVLEKAVKLAPETAKQYYATANAVNEILSVSQDIYVEKAFEIFDHYGMRSRAYLLLDAIVNNWMNMETADSLGNNRDGMFRWLVQLSSQFEANVTYSAYRFLDYYSADILRKTSEEALSVPSSFELFHSYSPDEMFILLTYGFREPLPETFRTLLEITRYKLPATTINSNLIISLNREKLKEFVIYCDKNYALNILLALVDDESKDYLLNLTSIEKPESPFPLLKSFTAYNAKINNKPKTPDSNEVLELSYSKISDQKEIDYMDSTSLTSAGQTIYTNVSAVNAMLEASQPEVVAPVSINLDSRTKTIVSLKKNIFQSIHDIPAFIEQDYAETLLNYAAEKEPDELLKKVEYFKNKNFNKNVLELCAYNAPVSLKRYLYNPSQPVNYILQHSDDSVVKKIFEINPQIGYRSKPLLLLNEIINGKITTAEAIEISIDPDRLFSAMVKIISRPKYIGKFSIDHEMRDYSLRFIREINDRIASGDEQPLYAVDGFGLDKLYFLMLYGRDEVFTSTFSGLFKRFMQKLPDQNGNIFLRSVNYNQFREFLSLCANFGTLEDFLTKFSEAEKQQLLVDYVSGLEKAKDDLSTVVLIAEAISNLTNDHLLSLLQLSIKNEYDRVRSANDLFGITIYGVLSSMISGNAAVEPAWYKKISEQFKISPVGSLSNSILFDERKICVEQMYFYNDDDGRSSFINFINKYKNQLAWDIEDKNSYVRVFSTSGMRIEILANKPGQEETGINAIHAYIKHNKLSPSIVIHRGHSFHTESTLEKVPPSTKLIFVGSCGGFYKISIALENAPEAHIISTKQVGTKSINDIMLFALNENIRFGKDIVWNDFWDNMRERLSENQYFSDYIPPNKNLETIFIRAYYKILGV